MTITETLFSAKKEKGLSFADLEKEEDPKGDRVRVIMSGKFLPYSGEWGRAAVTIYNN